MGELGSSTPLVDWIGLGKVFALAAIFGVGIVLVMSISIRLFAYGGTHPGGRRVMSTLGAGVGLIIVVATVIFGIYIMMKK